MSIVAEFSVAYRQYLDAKSKVHEDLPKFAQDKDELIKLYQLMTLVRTFDTKAINLQRTGKMGTYASTLGQEAVFVGMGHAMAKDDVLVPYYRDYGAMLQRGVTMTEILRYWGGDERGSHFENNAEDFPICVPIATQFLHAAGIATAIKYRKQQRAVVVSGGDGATSQGDFYEALNVAGEWNLPVVFVINNNQWAISVSRQAQTRCKTIAQKAIAGGFEGLQVDGNDIIAVRQVVDEALQKARSGEGPTLIEAMTYRLCDHTTADDASRYVPKEALDKAWAEEPIKRLGTYLQAHHGWDEKQQQNLEKDCQSQVKQAVEEYTNTKPQSISSIFEYMYDSMPKSLQHQRSLVDL